VGGTAVELNDRGLVVAGNATPLAADAVTQALTKAGIQVALTQAAATDHGVVAPSLSVTFSQYSDVIQRPVTIRYLLGASSASVLGGAPTPLPGPDVIAPGGSTVGPTDVAPPVAGPPASDGAPAPGGPSSVPAGSAPALSGGTAAADGSGGEAAQGAPSPNRRAGTGAPARRPFSPVASESAGWAWGSLYLVLVAAALVLAGGVELIRTLGVRKP
jgi:hypothetical protein